MASHTHVPSDHGARPVAKADLEVGTALDVRIEELQDSLRLFILEADDMASELAIDKEGLLTGDGVSPNNRMHRLDRLALDNAAAFTAPRELGLFHAGVHRRKGLQVRAEAGGQVVV